MLQPLGSEHEHTIYLIIYCFIFLDTLHNLTLAEGTMQFSDPKILGMPSTLSALSCSPMQPAKFLQLNKSIIPGSILLSAT